VLQLGFRLELYRSAQLQVPFDLVRLAEDLGFHSVWTAEAYGSDALSPLAAVAPMTTRIKLGTAVVQLAARPPATLGMQAMTIDALAGGGRMIIGLGVSGPQIVEGWYGQPWGKPTARLRDYITILRKVIAREGPVTHDGPEISLPYTGPGALGQGKALKSILHSPSDIPIWLASVGPKNTELCAELCDGWLPMGLPPAGTSAVADILDAGFAKRSANRPVDDFEVFTGLTVHITDDVKGWLDAQRPFRATYVGGMGSESHNYHVEAMARRGFPEEAARIQELFLAGRREEAIAAMPDEAMLQGALVGSPARIHEQWEAGGMVPPGVTGVIVGADRAEELELIAELVGTRDV
jgi:F420-dependent oxidoreductase-like protein